MVDWRRWTHSWKFWGLLTVALYVLLFLSLAQSAPDNVPDNGEFYSGGLSLFEQFISFCTITSTTLTIIRFFNDVSIGVFVSNILYKKGNDNGEESHQTGLDEFE